MMNLNHSKVSFIGAGKMAEALISGLCRQKALPPSCIYISDRQKGRMELLSEKYGVKSVQNNCSAIAGASIIVLAVKPQDMNLLLEEISPFVTRFQLVISIAAGITLDTLQKKLKKISLIRAMPNNPALAGAGITALSQGIFAKKGQLEFADAIFRTVGETIFVPEKYMDAVTALSGSGPAFTYLFLEGLIEGAKKAGLPALTAKRLALKTIEGSAQAAAKADKSFKDLVAMVASKGGTTEAGIKVLKKGKFKEMVQKTVLAAAKRSKELNK